jgi:hypothetical protein
MAISTSRPAASSVESISSQPAAREFDQVRQMRSFLDSKHKDHPNADGHMTEEQKRQYVKEFEAKLISPEEAALWQRGASNAGYHYLGCAKTFALMGRAFAEAALAMGASQNPAEAQRNPGLCVPPVACLWGLPQPVSPASEIKLNPAGTNGI